MWAKRRIGMIVGGFLLLALMMLYLMQIPSVVK